MSSSEAPDSKPTGQSGGINATQSTITAVGDIVGGDKIVGLTADDLAKLGARLSFPPAEGEAPLPAALDAHYKLVVKAIADGRLVPFLGSGANLCGRPENTDWQRDHYLPSADELTAYLADSFGFPANEPRDLLRVSQYVSTLSGAGPLYDELRALFDANYTPTPLHTFLANVPRTLRGKGYPRCLLIVTTNYDDTLERAFREAGEPFDLVSYIAEGDYRGKFVHWTTEGEPRLIEKPNEYRGLAPEQRSMIVKIHGAVDRLSAQWDSFVITEDHYIEFLSRSDISNLLPATLAAKLRKSHFLFMGYSLRDWNLRVILQRIWGEQKLGYKSWAIQPRPEALEQEFWRKRDVDLLKVRLEEYIATLAQRLHALSPPGSAR